MPALVVHESIYGNTRAVAEAIADGLRRHLDARTCPVGAADGTTIEGADLLVVGGPTHMHGLASSLSRRMAVQAGRDDGVDVEEDATGDRGLRKWLADLDGHEGRAAAFDTRLDRSPVMTGVAARGIAHRLRRHHFEVVADPESFLVEDAEGPLADGELERAREWGDALGRIASTA